MAAVGGGQQIVAGRGGPLAALQALSNLPALKQLGVMAGLAASVALGVWVVQWSRAPGYTLLFNNLPGKEATEVVAGLQRAGVAHQLDAQTGAVLVPETVEFLRVRTTAYTSGEPRAVLAGFDERAM